MKTFENFTGLYSLSKTLRFELKPEPQENFQWESFLESTIFKHDLERYNAYPIVKTMLDQFHKWFIEDSLQHATMDWTNLYEKCTTNKKDNQYVENLKKEQDKIRKEIVDTYFKKHEWWKFASKDYSKLFKQLLPELLTDDGYVEEILQKNQMYTREVMKDALKKFQNFTVYFKGYFLNRDNMYKSDAQGTAIANRIVNENFSKFANNIVVYKRLKEYCSSELSEVENKLKPLLYGVSFDVVFTPEYFNKCITQKGIEQYNLCISGKTTENKDEPISGINSVGNKYLQNHKEATIKLKELKMTKLYKQILSDRDRPSFIPEQFESEKQIISSIEDFQKQISEQQLYERLIHLMERLQNGECEELNKIHIVGSSITQLSKLLYGNWDVLGSALKNKYVTGTTIKAKGERETEIQEWIEKKSFNLAQIIEIEPQLKDENSIKVLDLFSTFEVRQRENGKNISVDLIKKCKDEYLIKFTELKKLIESGEKIQGNDARKETLKSVLDNYMNILHITKLLSLGKKESYLDKDESFYQEYNEILTPTEINKVCLEDIIPLYNKTRSFLTRKLADEGKMLMKFDCGTLADGWDKNKESDNASIILRKNGLYYLAIINKNNTKVFEKDLDRGKGFEKMDYKLIATPTGVGGFVRKCFNTAQNYGWSCPNSCLNDEGKIIIKNDEAIHNLKNLIDCYKDFFNKYEKDGFKYKDFNFQFKESGEYTSLDSFFNDVEQQGYKISWHNVSENFLYQLVNENKLFLFKIHNKDFKEDAKGTENLHTLYWKELFSEENLKNIVYKLNGKAELFYRKKIVEKPFTHIKGKILVNKTFSNGKPISSSLYKEYSNYFLKKIAKEQLSKEAQENLSLVKTNTAKLDLVKDKRYANHKLLFHVPITINFKEGDVTQKAFNQKALEILKKNKEELNIIGIDRGERNLLYVSVINQKGENIIPPKHFNIIETQNGKFDYLEKLKQREGNRDESRKNWTKIENIKELKNGYLSQVVHEIAKLVLEHNAIVVLEDLNFGFKRGRFSVERQIYQNFEKKLIEKLNFLVFKKNPYSTEFGNTLNGLQLTAPFKSFKELGKQSGILFYVNASYTSKIDPQTGFVNLFNMKDAKKDTKAFFQKFDEIGYEDGMFKFTFDYRKEFALVQTDYTNTWTVYSKGERIICVKDQVSSKNNYEKKNITKEIEELLLTEKLDKKTVNLKSILLINNTIFFDKLFWLFKLTLQLRNSDNEVDYLISPVKNNQNIFFDSRVENSLSIKDADANGAYNIARKGLYLIKNDFPMEKDYLKKISNEQWLQFAQENHNLE